MPEHRVEQSTAAHEVQRGGLVLKMTGVLRGFTYALTVGATAFYAGTLAERQRNASDRAPLTRSEVTPEDAVGCLRFELQQIRHGTERFGYIGTFAMALQAMCFALDEAQSCTDPSVPHPSPFRNLPIRSPLNSSRIA